MRDVIELFRQKRSFGLEQLTGLLMIGGAFLLYLRPQSLTFDWIETLYGLRPGLMATIGVVLMLALGYVLALHIKTTALVFAALTSPIGGLGVLFMVFGWVSNEASIMPGYLGTGMWLAFQIAHDNAEAFRRWTNLSAPSSHS